MLIRLISSLIRFTLAIVLLPLRMLSRNFVGTIILFGLIYFLWPKSEGTQPTQAPPSKGQVQRDAKSQPTPRVDPISKRQDGNSRFSDDVLSKMNPAELRHYSSAFFWVMRYQDEGIPHRWAFYNVKGTITPFGRFKNSFGHECRKFQEIIKVHEIQQNFDGLACERTDGGWCRLRNDSTPLCGIGENTPALQGLGEKLKSLF
jgi:hypothetical protein